MYNSSRAFGVTRKTSDQRDGSTHQSYVRAFSPLEKDREHVYVLVLFISGFPRI